MERLVIAQARAQAGAISLRRLQFPPYLTHFPSSLHHRTLTRAAMPLRKADREARARQQHNVVFEYPDFGLHSAAEHDNIGLVKYALNHGQPVNGARDGLLPLHLACSGGALQAARLLLETGADPNAERLPPPRPSRSLKPSSHKEKDLPAGSAPGATPLHFAAANGHAPLVLLLLRHGARPEKADKHGATPYSLAKQAGKTEAVRVLDDWAAARDADLRERGTRLGAVDPSLSLDSLPDDDAGRRKLNVQRSIDNVFGFGRLRANSALDSPQSAANAAYTGRRPSLPDPDIMMPATPPAKKGKGGGRPSSAGSGTGGPSTVEQKPRRLGSKMSLLGLFKRPSTDALSSSAASLNAPPSQSQSRSRHGSDASRPGILRPQHGRSSSGTGARLRFDSASQSSPSPVYLDEDDEEDFGRPVIGQGHRSRSRSIASTASLSPSAHAAAHRAGEFPFSIERPPEDADPCEGDEDDTLPRTARARDDSMSTTGSVALLRTPPGMAEVPMLYHKQSTTSLGPAALGVAIPASKSQQPTSPHSPPLSHSPSAPLLSAHHRPRAIDLGAISTHAQAAELVQRAQASVLALNKSQEEGQDAIFGDGEVDKDIPLSARLAAYGESLALARRLKEAQDSSTTVGEDLSLFEDPYENGMETVRGKPRAFSDTPSPVGLRKLNEDTFGRVGMDGMTRKVSRRGQTVDGQGRLKGELLAVSTSLVLILIHDISKGSPRTPRTPPHTRRRPHTAESATSNTSGGFLAPPDASFMHHHRSRSAAPVPSGLSEEAPLARTFGDDAPLAGAVGADAPRDDRLSPSPAPAGAVASLKREEGILGDVPTSPSPKKFTAALPGSEHGSPKPKRANSIRSNDESSNPAFDASTSSSDLFGVKPGALERQPQRTNSLRSVHEHPTGDLFGLKPGALERPAPIPDALVGKGSSSSSLGLKPSSTSLGIKASTSNLGVKAPANASGVNRGVGLGSSKPSLASIRDAKGSYAPTAQSIAQSFAAPPFDFDANLGILGLDVPPETFLERQRRGRMGAQEYERVRTPFAGVSNISGPTYGEELDLARMLSHDPSTPGAYDDDDGLGLQRIRTAPDGGGVRRANKLARMGITPEKDVSMNGAGVGTIGKGGKLRRWVGGLTGRV